jgi:hypothetical protein
MKTSQAIGLSTFGLLGLSIWVVFRGASDEPYMSFRASDAIVQIGVASALMALWVVLVAFISVQVLQNTLHPAWLTCFVLCALALYGLYDSPTGYISDLVKFGVVVR